MKGMELMVKSMFGIDVEEIVGEAQKGLMLMEHMATAFENRLANMESLLIRIDMNTRLNTVDLPEYFYRELPLDGQSHEH